MVPYWREAGVTHAGQWEETGDSRDNIQFANIYGSPRADYVYVKKAGSGVELKVWENQGSGGKFQKGEHPTSRLRASDCTVRANTKAQVMEHAGATFGTAASTTTSGSARRVS